MWKVAIYDSYNSEKKNENYSNKGKDSKNNKGDDYH